MATAHNIKPGAISIALGNADGGQWEEMRGYGGYFNDPPQGPAEEFVTGALADKFRSAIALDDGAEITFAPASIGRNSYCLHDALEVIPGADIAKGAESVAVVLPETLTGKAALMAFMMAEFAKYTGREIIVIDSLAGLHGKHGDLLLTEDDFQPRYHKPGLIPLEWPEDMRGKAGREEMPLLWQERAHVAAMKEAPRGQRKRRR